MSVFPIVENFRDIMLKARQGLCDEFLGYKQADGNVAVQDAPIERDLSVGLEELYNGCTRKLKITRRVRFLLCHFCNGY